MNLSELIAAYGDEKVRCQALDECATKIDYHHKKGTTITFGTPEMVGPNGMERLGLIVWMDRDRAAEIVALAKAEART